ncbi:MAG: ABC transporter permease subunit [Lachnospiraceae bacterium]
MASAAENTKDLLAQYPEAFVKAMNLDQFDMTNILHYFASRSYIIVTLFGSVYAVMLSSCILSKEESERTIEFLISKPITRHEIVSAKYLCVLIYLLLFNLLFAVSNFGLMQVFKTSDFETEPFLLISLGGFLTHIIFASVCYLLSVFITNTRTIISISFGTVFITYFLSILVSVEDNLSFLRYLSPFSYFSSEDLVINSTIDTTYLVISVLVILLSVGLAYLFYSRKDITA